MFELKTIIAILALQYGGVQYSVQPMGEFEVMADKIEKQTEAAKAQEKFAFQLQNKIAFHRYATMELKFK